MKPTLGPLLSESIRIQAGANGIPEALVRAIALVESGGKEFALRAEPFYRYLWDCEQKCQFRALRPGELASAVPPQGFKGLPGLGISAASEWAGQKTSWGPLQVMGAVAREYGFKAWFPELCGTLGVYYGCLHLARLKKRFLSEHGWEGVAAAYNAGSPQRSNGRWENQLYIDKLRAAGCHFVTL